MRVIRGTLKGKPINYLKNASTRPLKDAVKENIFNILEHSNIINLKITDSDILDLYSGIGSFGIECISRGAKKVTFVEQETNAANILKDNLVKLSISDRSNIYNDKIEDFLDKDINEKFNIFFLDPPFVDSKFFQILKSLKQKKLFKKDHIVIIHRDKKTKEQFTDFLKIIETRQYGRSKIMFGLFS